MTSLGNNLHDVMHALSHGRQATVNGKAETVQEISIERGEAERR